jgi:hypothetical protein
VCLCVFVCVFACVSLCERECVLGGFFWDRLNVHTLINYHPDRRRVKGWLRRDGWMGGWVDGWAEGWVDGGMGGWVGLQKLITDLDMRNGYKGGVRF